MLLLLLLLLRRLLRLFPTVGHGIGGGRGDRDDNSEGDIFMPECGKVGDASPERLFASTKDTGRDGADADLS